MWVLGGIYRLELFDLEEFDKWVAKAMAPAIEASLKLYEEVLGLGFKVFLLTGRSEKQRGFIVKNLNDAGFQNWDKLILRWVWEMVWLIEGNSYCYLCIILVCLNHETVPFNILICLKLSHRFFAIRFDYSSKACFCLCVHVHAIIVCGCVFVWVCFKITFQL